ncbi:MAG: gerKC [Eubacterium sp.]|nr:gerKC [Eubacterium sp.]
MKKSIALTKLIFSLITLLLLTGCLGGIEINDLEIVTGMAVDKATDSESILLTAQIVKPSEMGKSSGGSGGGNKNAFWNVSYTGKSVFEATRQITYKTGNKLFLSHDEVVIFGKDIAEENIQKYIDFFLRENTMRPGTLVLVAEGRASDILDAGTEKEKLPAINAANLVKNYGFTSQLYEINLNDFAGRLISSTTSPIAPLIKVATDNGKKDVAVSGMAVFNKGKMAGTLNEAETRGLLWVLNKIKSGVITIPAPDGKGKVAFEIADAKSSVEPVIKGNKIFINIKVKQKAILSEQSTTENLENVQEFETLQKSLTEAIRHEIMTAYNKSKELNSDIFGFGDMLHRKYRKEWKTLENKWKDIYPQLILNIDVEAQIAGTDLLTRPAAPKKE